MGEQGRGNEGRVAPMRLGTLYPAVEEGREGMRARREAWVGPSRHFYTLRTGVKAADVWVGGVRH